MDNQHQKITGYRDLTQDEIDLMNEIKGVERGVAGLLVKVQHNAGGLEQQGEALRQPRLPALSLSTPLCGLCAPSPSRFRLGFRLMGEGKRRRDAAGSPPAVCDACGEPATRLDCEGVPLCAGCYAHLLEHWRLERGP